MQRVPLAEVVGEELDKAEERMAVGSRPSFADADGGAVLLATDVAARGLDIPGVDWVIHMGHEGKKKPGPLQAFNVSLPIWFDGLNKHEFMNSLRRLWLAKLALIHEIKYSYGPGVGKPGPVDDWAKSKPTGDGPSITGDLRPAAEIEFDEKMSFGSGFDPSEWA